MKRASSESKTKGGRRSVYLPGHVYHTLEARRALQAARALQLGGLWRDHNLVLTRPTGEPPDIRLAYGERLRVLAGRAGITGRFTAYSPRYSFATLALPAGELDVSVSRQMVRSNVNFTKDVYTETLPAVRRRLSDNFERPLAESTGNKLARSGMSVIT